MIHVLNIRTSLFATIILMIITSCHQLIETDPVEIYDTADVKIVCDARDGNKGLLGYSGNVYVHVGLITDKSEHVNDWRYVKFKWGSRDQGALATPIAKNKWEYSIKNIRQFFNVPEDEKIKELVILFRSGACIDIYCKVLRNVDDSDIHIPIIDRSGLQLK